MYALVFNDTHSEHGIKASRNQGDSFALFYHVERTAIVGVGLPR